MMREGVKKIWLRTQIIKLYTKTIDQRRVLTGLHSLKITGNISIIGKIESKVQVKLKYDEEGLGKEK